MNTANSIIVDMSGQGDVTTIQQALDLAPDDASPYSIFIRPGQYREKLHITRPNTHLIGDSIDNTSIVYTSANGLLANDGKIWATYNSYVVNLDNENVTLQSLTIENTFDFTANQQKPDSDASKIKGTQAVALLIGENGDHIQCKNCMLKSYQDTLFVSAGTNYFESVTIWGTVDFVFGGGTALFNHCQLVSRWRGDVTDNSPWGYVAAPSTLIDKNFGFVFYQCQLQKENNKVPKNSYKLGRPWHPTTQFDDGSYANPYAIGQCIYIECEIDDHINGWDKMHGKGKDGHQMYFYPEESRFLTCHNRYINNVPDNHLAFEIEHKQKQQYTLSKILNNWIPSLQVLPTE